MTSHSEGNVIKAKSMTFGITNPIKVYPFFFLYATHLLRIEVEQSKKTRQLLSNHWGSNQTPEFCKGQNKKNAIKNTV